MNLSPFLIKLSHYLGCGLLSLDNGDVNYTKGLVVGSVATHTCNPGYQLLPQGGEIRSCTRDNGWGGQNIMCVRGECACATDSESFFIIQRIQYVHACLKNAISQF